MRRSSVIYECFLLLEDDDPADDRVTICCIGVVLQTGQVSSFDGQKHTLQISRPSQCPPEGSSSTVAQCPIRVSTSVRPRRRPGTRSCFTAWSASSNLTHQAFRWPRRGSSHRDMIVPRRTLLCMVKTRNCRSWRIPSRPSPRAPPRRPVRRTGGGAGGIPRLSDVYPIRSRACSRPGSLRHSARDLLLPKC